MNLYGWRLSSFRQVLGSKDSALLEAATARLAKDFSKDPAALARAKAWLQTLIESGFPLRQDRPPPSEPADGGLLTVQMETATHVAVVHELARAIAREDDLDLAIDSSSWAHPAVGSLYEELASCGFTRSKDCSVQYHSWMVRLIKGTPLFGDDFRTSWEFYTWFTNEELAAMVPVFQAAADFKRPLPKGYPQGARKKMRTGLSEGGKAFIGDLIKWFSQIQQAGQDAFILWW
jgi:hypothetical protein